MYSGYISTFVHSYCPISSSIPFVIQRRLLVCEQFNSWHVLWKRA